MKSKKNDAAVIFDSIAILKTEFENKVNELKEIHSAIDKLHADNGLTGDQGTLVNRILALLPTDPNDSTGWEDSYEWEDSEE